MKSTQPVRSGFSLLEMLIALAIVVTLIVFTSVNYATIRKKGRDDKRRIDLEKLRSALELYRAENNSYPTVGASLWVTIDPNVFDNYLIPNYIDEIPTDPLQGTTTPYRYIVFDQRPPGSGNYFSYCISANMEIISNAAPNCWLEDPNNNYQINNL